MTLIEKLREIERLDQLIRLKSTGSPSELASRLQRSERSVYQLINMMKNMGAPVYYCNNQRSYCYRYGVEFSPVFTRKREFIGGKFYNPLLQNICSSHTYLSHSIDNRDTL